MTRVGIAGDTLCGNVSGVGYRLLEIVRHGGFEGYETVVYGAGERPAPVADAADAVAAVDVPLGVDVLPEPLAHAWWENVSVGRAASSDGVDLYFAPNYLRPLTLDAKSIVVVHDLVHERHPEYLPRSYTAYLKALLPRSLRRADAIITVSRSTREDVLDVYDVPAAKVDVVHGAAAPRYSRANVASADVDRVRTAYDLDEEFVLYVGNLEPRKNVHRIVEALAELPAGDRPELAIAGQQFHAYEALERVSRSSPAADRVNFLGYVEEADLPALYAAARAFVYPSLYEGFGLPVLEAMAAGTPVVTSDRSSLPEVAGDGGIAVDPRSTTELAEAIARLQDDDTHAEWQERALERASEFSWEDSAGKVNRIVGEVLDR